MQRHGPGPLYAITPEGSPRQRSHLDWVRLFIESGIRFLQVRDKTLPANRLLGQLLDIQQLCAETGTVLIVNDRLDLAAASGAAGVHLGQDDLPAPVARRIGGSSMIIGISTHSEEEFLRAQELDVDYVAVGPVFESPTKPGVRRPLGIELIRALAARKRKPLVAIGGITPVRARMLWDVGADSVAVISDITDSPDPVARIGEYLKAGEP